MEWLKSPIVWALEEMYYLLSCEFGKSLNLWDMVRDKPGGK